MIDNCNWNLYSVIGIGTGMYVVELELVLVFVIGE